MELLLREHLVDLTENLSNSSRVLVHLEQKQVISNDEVQRIKSSTTDADKNYELITILRKKDKNSTICTFVEVLKNTGNQHLALKIEQSASEKGLQYLLSVPSTSSSKNNAHRAISYEPESSKNLQEKVSDNATDSCNPKRILEEKWWPEIKILIQSFLDRIDGGQLIIERLHSLLQENENKTTAITQDKLVVSGLGGIGKTSIAKSFALRYETEYEYILWIDCGEGSLIKSFQSLARDLNLEHRSELSPVELAKKCFSVFEERRCLIIYDNAECYVGNQGIRDVLPKVENKNLHSIITSRNQEWGHTSGYGKITVYSMNVFGKEESMQFMKNSIFGSEKLSDSYIVRLSELLGHLPLAMQIAVATLNKQEITITEYIEELLQNDEAIINQNFDDYERTINKTMKISLKQIKKDTNGKMSFDILMSFGYILPDDIPISFFQQTERVEMVKIKNAIDILEKYSLVSTATRRSKQKYVSIHRLLQQVIRHNGKKIEKETLTKILSGNGEISYKLIPFSYAENYPALKKDFSALKAQLIDQLKLTELLTDRRFDEAVKLSWLIHNTFNKYKFRKKFLISKHNHAVCLRKNGQLSESLESFKSLYNELQRKTDKKLFNDLPERLGFDDNNDLEFTILPFSSDINRFLLGYYLLQFEISDHELFNFENPLHLNYVERFSNKYTSFDEKLIILLTNLRRVEENGFSNQMFAEGMKLEAQNNKSHKKENFKFDFVLNLLKRLEVVTIEHFFGGTDATKSVIRKSCSFLRRNCDIYADIAAINCKEQTMHFPSFIELAGKEEFCGCICDLLVIRRTWFGWLDNVGQEWAKALGEHKDYLSEVCTTSHSDWEFHCKGVEWIPLSRLPESFDTGEMKSVTLQRLTVQPECFALCKNLTKIILHDVILKENYKFELPTITHFEVRLHAVDKLDVSTIDRFAFFGGSLICVWKAIQNLIHFEINEPGPKAYVKYLKESQILLFEGVNLEANISFSIFHKIKLVSCNIFEGQLNKNECCCSNCQINELINAPYPIADSNLAIQLSDRHSSEKTPLSSSLREIIIEETKFTDLEASKHMTSYEISDLKNSKFLLAFINRFEGVQYLECRKLNENFNLMELKNIHKVQLSETKLYCMAEGDIMLDGNNNRSFNQIKELILCNITPVDFFGNEQSTLDFSSLKIIELEWTDFNDKRYHIVPKRLPTMLEKLTLDKVGLKYPVIGNDFEMSSVPMDLTQHLTIGGLNEIMYLQLLTVENIDSSNLFVFSIDKDGNGHNDESSPNYLEFVQVISVNMAKLKPNDSINWEYLTCRLSGDRDYIIISSELFTKMQSFTLESPRFNCRPVSYPLDLPFSVVNYANDLMISRSKGVLRINLMDFESVQFSYTNVSLETEENHQRLNGNNAANRTMRKLELHGVTLLNLQGERQNGIDMSYVRVKELKCMHNYYYLYRYVTINKLPSELQKLTLLNCVVEPLITLKTNDQSNNTYFGDIDNLTFLKTLDLASDMLLKLNLMYVPHSIKALKLNGIKIINSVLSQNALDLDTLILINYTIEDLHTMSIQSLLGRTRSVLISFSNWCKTEELLPLLPCNVTCLRVNHHNQFGRWYCDSSYEMFQSTKLGDKHNWEQSEITYEQFKEHENI